MGAVEAVGLGRIARSSALIRARMLLSVMGEDPSSVWGGVVVTHSGKGGRMISDWRTLATGATARPRACVPLKNQHQLRMLRNGGAAPWQRHSH